MRRYQRDDDYWHIRQFLRDLLLINNRDQISWEVARFDYWRWHGILNMKDGTLEDDVFIWESRADMVAVLNREAPGSVFLQIHPGFRTCDLVAEMLSTAEQYLTVPDQKGHRSLHVWAAKEDQTFQKVLKGRDYTLCENRNPEHQRRRELTEPILRAPAAGEYTIRSMGDVEEHRARCWVSWRAFHPDEPDSHFEDRWYHNVQQAPLYRRDLDLVAVAPNAELASFCTVWYDDVTRTGLFEPVGTAPQHQRKGLGRAILTEGLLRLRHVGADLAFIGSYNEPAHALYDSVGFQTYRILEPWCKEIAS
jgi:mycothiol synthase